MVPRSHFTIPLPDGRALCLGERTLVMGILNVTPDSFTDGGRHFDPGAAEAAAVEMQACGADLIGVGGEAPRAGPGPGSAGGGICRLLPGLKGVTRAPAV